MDLDDITYCYTLSPTTTSESCDMSFDITAAINSCKVKCKCRRQLKMICLMTIPEDWEQHLTRTVLHADETAKYQKNFMQQWLPDIWPTKVENMIKFKLTKSCSLFRLQSRRVVNRRTWTLEGNSRVIGMRKTE